MLAKPMKYSAQEIYKVIRSFDLSKEKSIAIEQAKTDSPTLVVAGAGSGKTELLAVRVLWLIANGYCRPEEVLGLTFTKKAATELSKRIFESLIKLRDSSYWPEDLEFDFSPPTISTYNAYANSIFREHSLALGYEAESLVVSEAAAFQLAREVVLRHGSEINQDINELEASLDSLVEAVLSLSQQLTDNQVSSKDVTAEIGRTLEHIALLPKKLGEEVSTRFAYVDNIALSFRGTPAIAELAELFQIEKQSRSLVDYSDQVALAERATREIPESVMVQRSKYSQVFLDEYQDTSYLQTKLLSQLFKGTSVFAVGDPNQSIYGWRGASSSNLNEFAEDFGAAKHFQLATSWRNPKSVLDLANQIAIPLSNEASFVRPGKSSAQVRPVELTASEGAVSGRVQHVFVQDMETEAKEIAKWFQSNQSEKSSQALLLRKRASMQLFVDALESAGLEVEVIGLGGLLEMPEIVDLVSALKVIHRPDSGSQLIRLLTGARFRIGLKDIERLNEFGRKLKTYKPKNKSPEDELSLVEALDVLLESKHPFVQNFSETGLQRLKQAGNLFRLMRSEASLPLPEFVRIVAEELWIDIELRANPNRKNPMAHLNGFYEVVAGYSLGSSSGQLGGFLNWLDYATQRERFEIPKVNPTAGVVQVLTIHAAKGLEWDFVAVPNLVEGDFPSTGKGSSGWLSLGKLPFPLRGDKQSLPVFDYQSAKTQSEIKSASDVFKSDNRIYQLREETRLMYVATTRPKQALLLSGSYWKPNNKTPKNPSEFFLTSLPDGFEIPELESQENPLELVAKVQSWPLDPVGDSFRAHLDSMADQTSKALGELESISILDLNSHSIHQEIDLLIRERDDALNRLNEVKLPVRIPASKFKEFLGDFEGQAASFARPMPSRPYRATRTGNLFHAWVEDYYAETRRLEATSQEFEDLRSVFENSRFADAVPVDIELEINLTRGQNTFICKLDAVFATEDGFEIVDWKTGEPPKTQEDQDAMTLQLALYRFAYAEHRGIPLEKVFVSFYFVSTNTELVPKKIPTPDELMALWEKLFS